MKVINQVKMSFPSRSVNESFARVTAAAMASQADPTIDVIADIKTAVSEAVTNAVVHAYPKEIGMIYITMKMFEGGIFSVTVKDKGVGIDDVKLARTACYTTSPETERSGMGFTVMEVFMDKVKVISKLGVGTTVTMTKKLI